MINNNNIKKYMIQPMQSTSQTISKFGLFGSVAVAQWKNTPLIIVRSRQGILKGEVSLYF